MSTYYLSRGDETMIFHRDHVTDHGRKPVTDSWRPVVVIDPEDSEAVARLVELLGDNGWRPTERHGLRDALREFANPTPPKPDEPTGLGAVVETPGGRYVRSDVETCNPWRGPKGIPFEWDDLDGPVRVLSEGVAS